MGKRKINSTANTSDAAGILCLVPWNQRILQQETPESIEWHCSASGDHSPLPTSAGTTATPQLPHSLFSAPGMGTPPFPGQLCHGLTTPLGNEFSQSIFQKRCKEHFRMRSHMNAVIAELAIKETLCSVKMKCHLLQPWNKLHSQSNTELRQR